MPALAEFLKGTVQGSLKGLIAPAGIIPAGLFILLNLAFVLPEARDREVGWVVDFYELDGAGWQAVTIATAIMFLAYLLGSASAVLLDTLSGRTWKQSLL